MFGSQARAVAVATAGRVRHLRPSRTSGPGEHGVPTDADRAVDGGGGLRAVPRGVPAGASGEPAASWAHPGARGAAAAARGACVRPWRRRRGCRTAGSRGRAMYPIGHFASDDAKTTVPFELGFGAIVREQLRDSPTSPYRPCAGAGSVAPCCSTPWCGRERRDSSGGSWSTRPRSATGNERRRGSRAPKRSRQEGAGAPRRSPARNPGR